MNNADFVHLHSHSCYSKFDGACSVANMCLQSRQMGFKSLAITDHGNVGAWIKFYQECKKKKDKNDKEIPYPTLKPIFGSELYLARDHNIHSKDEGQPDGRKGNRHIILLAKNEEGYKNLATLSQLSWVEGQYSDPRIDFNDLAKHSKGLICQSACLGSIINANLLKGRYDKAREAAIILKDIFGEDFFLEVQYHGLDVQSAIIPDVFGLGKELGIPVVATNDFHYCKKEHAKSQEVLMAMSTSRCIKDPKHVHFPYNEFYMKSADEMALIFGSHPEVLLNTVAVSERVEDFLKTGGMRLPKFDTPEAAKENEIESISVDMTPFQFLEKLAWDGMKRLKWDNSEKHIEALKMELGDVKVALDMNGMDFPTYFLVVWDYVNFARRNKIQTGCGRGSGYASVLLRCLGITYGVDPIKYGLIWERFLGFDVNWVLLDSDWGFDEPEEESVLISTPEEEDRPVEEDEGGVDRY